MASSTPAHCTISGAKPYQNRRKISITPHIPVTKTATGSANICPRNPSFPSLASKTELGVDFNGRRSTRLVSKMHFGRPRAASLSQRHTSAAEELLHHVTQLESDDDWKLCSILVGSEGKVRCPDDYLFLLRELGNLGFCWKALRCYEFAVKAERRRTEQGKLASAMISVLGRLGKVDLARGVFDAASREGYGNTVYVFSALISAYGRSGHSDEAIRVFESMKGRRLKPNLVTYNAVIDACGKGGGEFGKAAEIFEEMVRRGVQPDRITYNSLLAVCGRGGDWITGKKLFREMVVCRGIEPDIFTYNTLLDGVCKGGQMDLAFDIMSEMVMKGLSPNVVSYSTVIDGFAKEGRFSEALALFNQMKMAGVGLDRVLFNTLLSIYAKLGRFDEVLTVCGEMESCGIMKDAVTYNALMGGYGRQGKYDEVKRVFSEMKLEQVSPNLLTYSTLIDLYSKGALYGDAMEVFMEFKQTGLKADVVLYSALIDSLCKGGLVESAVSLLDKMTMEGIRPNVVTYNSIIDAFGRSANSCGDTSCGDIVPWLKSSSLAEDDGGNNMVSLDSDQVMRAFGQLISENIDCARRDISMQCELSCILDVFRKMHDREIKPNVVTFSAILNACSRCNSIYDASMLLEELRLFDNQVYGVAHGLLMGLKDNIWVQAVSLFDEVKQMDSTTATAFFNALTDMLWHFGQKCGAEMVVLEGKRRRVWENVWTESCLDLHLMSSGAARAMVHAWLLNIRTVVFQGQELPKLLSILTGWGKHSKVVGEGALRRAIEALLSGLGAPFRVAQTNIGRFISSGSVVASWLRESGTLTLLLLRDVKTACCQSPETSTPSTTHSPPL